MLGGPWDCGLFGNVWASGLHTQLVDVKMCPKEVQLLIVRATGLHNAELMMG